MLSSLFRLFKDVYRVTGIKLVGLVALTTASALLEGAALAALLPLLSGMPSGEVPSDRVTSVIYAVLAYLGMPATAFGVAALAIFLILIGAAVFLVQAYYAARLQTDYVAHWQKALFKGYFSARYGFFRERRGGDLISAGLTEPIRLGGAFYQANLILSSILFISVQVLVALVIAPVVVLLLLGVGTTLFLVSVGLVRRGLAVGEQITRVNADFQTDSGELIAGAKFVKATATETRALSRLTAAIERMRHLTFTNAFDVQIVRAIFEYASGLTVIALLVAGPMLLSVDIGAVLVIVAMFIRLFPKVTGLRQCQQSISLVLPAFDAVSEMLTSAEAAREVLPEGAKALPRAAGPAAITFDSVSVEIEGRTIMSEVSCDIAPGSFVTITGPTGAGKTTLLDCMLGLRPIASGRVMIDGVALEALSMEQWRRSIGYLGQDPMMFHATIEENLKWIKPESTMDELAEALRRASAEFVYKLPNGLETSVGDAGGRLSGGDRQRLALARARLGSPRLLVLDEATSALDSGTEASVVATIEQLKGQLTIVSITHREAMVGAADRVIEVRDGRIVTRRAEARKGV